MKGGVVLSSKNNAILSADELDTIGEIMNITMGSAATAVSMMLEKQVMITTPRLTQDALRRLTTLICNQHFLLKYDI